MITERYYQIEAKEKAICHLKKSLDSQVIVLPTGAGKSVVIANLAKDIHAISGKKVLCTAPNSDLVAQNHKKFTAYGYKASVFCASAGRKELRHDVVFGSPLSLLNEAKNGRDRLSGFGAIIIDECDQISNTVKELIAKLKDYSPNLRIIGLTATPYRMGMGYIYQNHYRDGWIEETEKPYFDCCTYECYAKDLIEQGFLTKPMLGKRELAYNTEGLILKKTGKWDSHTVDEAFSGRGRLTADIIADIVEATQGYNGVIIYASTIQHAEECLESLPRELSGIIHSKLPPAERKKTMNNMAEQKIKYVVNVDVLTVGIDWPHVDCIAMLRATESARLYQQIIGRTIRLYPGKEFSLILDYAGNNARHFPSGDVFSPKVKARAANSGDPDLIAICPQCSHENEFIPRPNDAGYAIGKDGYFYWSDTKEAVLDGESRPVPAHMGRRCKGIIDAKFTRCSYRWSFKLCESCQHENDIAARYCESCKAELLDPNEKLAMEQKEREERPLIEPILSIELFDEFKGDKRIKVAKIKTLFGKYINVFMRVSKEEDRDRYRYFRDNKLDDMHVEFMRKQDAKYYKFLGIK